MKLHFASSIIFVAMLCALALNNNINTRMLLMVAVLVMFYTTLVLFGVEYDREMRIVWDKKEKALLKDSYLKFVGNYYKNSKQLQK